MKHEGGEARMDNLKSCPFCGGVTELNAPGYKYYSPYWCKCTRCGAEGPTKLSELEAEKGWNERTKDISGWISVKDRLPERQEPVIVYAPPYDESEAYVGSVGVSYYTQTGSGGYWAGIEGNVYGAIGTIHDPTHWIPLPKPPKEDD